MKILLLSIAGFFLISPVWGQLFNIENRKDSAFEQGIHKANISRHLVYEYKLDDNPAADSSLIAETLYDSLGNITDSKLYRNGKLETQFIFFYTANLLARVNEENFTVPFKLVHEIKYDSIGRPFTEYNHPPKSSKGVTYAYIYNNDHQLTAIHSSFNKKDYYLFTEYIYEQGKLSQSQTYSTGTKTGFSKFYEYDETGRLHQISHAAGETHVNLNSGSSTTENYILREIYFYNSDNTLSHVNVMKGDKLATVFRHYYFKF